MINDLVHLELRERAKKMISYGSLRLDKRTSAIQFLRGVSSEATFVLPAFYLHLGAGNDDKRCAIEGYPGLIFRRATDKSAFDAVSLACRKTFDSGKGLTGAAFANLQVSILEDVAQDWSKSSSCPHGDALTALTFLKEIFKTCAKSDNNLLVSEFPLAQRIGLLKQHANGTAAHLSLGDFSVATLDCVHIVAALTIIGEIIRSFDEPGHRSTYFDEIDAASLKAAQQLFPGMPSNRLFANTPIRALSDECWQSDLEIGKKLLLERLPESIGWY